jgi:hypothetical protein
MTKEDEERHVIEQARMIVRLNPIPGEKNWELAWKDLKTAVAFLEAQG